MNTLLDIDHWLSMSKIISPKNCRFMLRYSLNIAREINQRIFLINLVFCFFRRTPRRKLVFSSSDDETDDSPQSGKKFKIPSEFQTPIFLLVHNLRQCIHHSIIQDEQ